MPPNTQRERNSGNAAEARQRMQQGGAFNRQRPGYDAQGRELTQKQKSVRPGALRPTPPTATQPTRPVIQRPTRPARPPMTLPGTPDAAPTPAPVAETPYQEPPSGDGGMGGSFLDGWDDSMGADTAQDDWGDDIGATLEESSPINDPGASDLDEVSQMDGYEDMNPDFGETALDRGVFEEYARSGGMAYDSDGDFLVDNDGGYYSPGYSPYTNYYPGDYYAVNGSYGYQVYGAGALDAQGHDDRVSPVSNQAAYNVAQNLIAANPGAVSSNEDKAFRDSLSDYNLGQRLGNAIDFVEAAIDEIPPTLSVAPTQQALDDVQQAMTELAIWSSLAQARGLRSAVGWDGDVLVLAGRTGARGRAAIEAMLSQMINRAEWSKIATESDFALWWRGSLIARKQLWDGFVAAVGEGLRQIGEGAGKAVGAGMGGFAVLALGALAVFALSSRKR